MINKEKLQNAIKFYEKNFKRQTEFTNVVKVAEFSEPALLSYTQTEYTQIQKDTNRLDTMENKMTEAYKFEDSTGEILTIWAPLRLVEKVQEKAKEKLGDKYISVTKEKK